MNFGLGISEIIIIIIVLSAFLIFKKSKGKKNQFKEGKQNNRSEEQKEKKQENKRNSSEKESYYAVVLGLKGEVNKEEIKRAYRKKMNEYHPDKVNKLGQKLKKLALEESQKINEAYEYFKEKYDI
tara:strand:+ start:1030 stop:1407 length:378 start_codon:yes stop_codon:yes gene_type:complete